MKENKILSGRADSSNSEEEKSKLEIVEEEVKGSIFSVFYLLLKSNETSYWKFIIVLLIEYIQLLSYPFDDTVNLTFLINVLSYRWLTNGAAKA